MQVVIPISLLDGLAHGKKPGFREAIESAGERKGTDIYLHPADHAAIMTHFTPDRITGIGDVFHVVAKPVAVAARADCIDPTTQQLKPTSGCAQRRARWNAVFPLRPVDKPD